MSEIIGKVSATESNPTTADEFSFWLRDGALVAPFDIVVVPNAEGTSTFGQITELFYVTDSPSHIGNYVSSDFGSTENVANTPRLGTTYVKAEVLGNSGGVYMPVRDGEPVRFATGPEVKAALGIDQIPADHIPVPAGLIRLPKGGCVDVSFDSHYLLGPDGAHMNIGGISGLATKTSYAMFVLRAIQQRRNDTAIIVMNVKGQDLLHLHRQDGHLSSATVAQWKDCGLACEPFSNVRYFYPFTDEEPRHYAKTLCDPAALTDQFRNGMAQNYVYTFSHDRKKLDLLFSGVVDDPALTVASIMSEIENNKEFEGVGTWEELLEKVQSKGRAGSGSGAAHGIQPSSWQRFYRFLNLYLGGKKVLGSSIYQNAVSGLEKRHQVLLSDCIERIKPGDVFVVDIAALDEQDKFLVFGDVVDAVYRTKTEGASAPDRVVVFVDELNKYAPSGGKESPITQKLIEITERGRSQGMVLFGAQQFKSAVHDRVTGNCSNEVYGRTNAIETTRPPYRGIPKSYLSMMMRLGQGHLILGHPRFPKLLKIEFPRPSYFQPKPR